jgi:predicted nucleic acid-binding protein
MTEYLADTFYWLAMLNRDDVHRDAVLRWNAPPGRLVLTDAVRLEVMDAFSNRRLRHLGRQFWDDTMMSPVVVIVPADEDRMTRAADLFHRRPDKDWSLTDCLSFVVMTHRGIRTALSGDHHFEQAGFEIAFKP